MKARAVTEAKVDAERMLLATHSALEADGALLSDTERADIQALVQQLQTTAAQSQDAAVVEAAIDALAQGTEAFAAERMNHSIQKALAGRKIESL